MAVTSSTGTIVPVIAEAMVTSIAGGPFDFVTAYVQGGDSVDGKGQLSYRLYALVGTATTLLAETIVFGGPKASILQWQVPASGDRDSQFIQAGGTTYTVTVTALPTSPLPRNPVIVTLAGDDQFDTVADTNISPTLVVGSFSEVSSANVGGYAQFMDVSVNQSGLPQSTTITIYANNGAGSVEAIVAQLGLPGPDGTTVVLRKVALPIASVYRVSVRNNTGTAISVPIAIGTYSVSITPGGIVALNGDVIGPSNANTVIKWDNVPLLLGAAPGFGAPVDAAVPIYDIGLNEWRTFALSGGVTMTNAGVVTVVPAGITPGPLFGELLTTLGPPGTPTSLPLSAQWIPPTNNPTWTQATWFIDPANSTGLASDQNSGIDATHPVLTYNGGVVAKWGTTAPILRQDTTITWLSSQPSGIADAVVFQPTMQGSVLTLQGTTPATVHAGALAGVIAKNRATAQLLEADLGFAATPGQMVRNTTVGKSSIAWVYAQVAGTTFQLSQPGAPAVMPILDEASLTEVDTWADGDTFEILQPVAVQVASVNPIVSLFEAPSFPFPVQIYQMSIVPIDNIPGDANCTCGGQVTTVESVFQSGFFIDAPPDNLAAIYWNSFFAEGTDGIAANAGATQVFAGVILQGPDGSFVPWSISFDTILDEFTILGSLPGGITLNDVYLVGLTFFSGLVVCNDAIIWGPGIVDGIGNTRIIYGSGAGAATATFLNTGGLQLNAQTRANSFNPTTGLWSAAIALTPANLDLAFGAGGFGGLALNLGGAAFSNQATA